MFTFRPGMKPATSSTTHALTTSSERVAGHEDDVLPVGTPPNAIVFGTGTVTIGQMARGGFVLNIVGIVLITMFIYLLGGFALGIAFG